MKQGALRVGLRHIGEDSSIDDLRAVWRIADQSDLDYLWDSDHLDSTGPGGPGRPVFEAWTLLAAMAAATSRIRIGCMVTSNTYRHPALLGKMAATVDLLSGGRLEFGIGAGWGEAEHHALGIDGLAHRVGRLSESLQILKSLWTEPHTTFRGRYFVLENAVANPKPVQRPHPPIWVGAGGKQMMKIVARHADVWNVSARARRDIDTAATRAAELDHLCAEIGRDSNAIRRSVDLLWDGADRPLFVNLCSKWIAAGFSDINVVIVGADAPRLAERVCLEVAPELKKIPVAS